MEGTFAAKFDRVEAKRRAATGAAGTAARVQRIRDMFEAAKRASIVRERRDEVGAESERRLVRTVSIISFGGQSQG